MRSASFRMLRRLRRRARHAGSCGLHVDAAQSVGNVCGELCRLGRRPVVVVAHKAYGPKGIGALVASRKRGVQLQAQQFGGGQERNLRSGTVPTHQVVGMGLAFVLAKCERAAETERNRTSATALVGRTRVARRRAAQRRRGAHRAARAQRLVRGTSKARACSRRCEPYIAVSTGSACMSAVQEASYVLRALGRGERLAESSLRFSLGRFSTDADVDVAVAAVTDAVAASAAHCRPLPAAQAETADELQ